MASTILSQNCLRCLDYKIWRLLISQVSPSELEGMLFGHPAVLDVGVVGIPDELHDSNPKAFVVKNAGIEVTDKQLCDHVASEFNIALQIAF